jgi:hypothetical protein
MAGRPGSAGTIRDDELLAGGHDYAASFGISPIGGFPLPDRFPAGSTSQSQLVGTDGWVVWKKSADTPLVSQPGKRSRGVGGRSSLPSGRHRCWAVADRRGNRKA